MQDIKIKYGESHTGLNAKWVAGFKTEADFLEKAMPKETLKHIPEAKRSEILKAEYAKLQPKEEAKTPAAKK